MKKIAVFSLMCLLFVIPFSLAETQTPSAKPFFVENVGQFAGEGRFLLMGEAGAMWAVDEGVWFTFVAPDMAAESSPGVHVFVRFVGADGVVPFGEVATRLSYARGNDPAGWHSDVPVWSGVRYPNLPSGADLEITGEAGRLMQHLAGGDAPIEIEITGAEAIELVENVLLLETAVGQVVLPPFVGGAEVVVSTPAGQTLAWTTPTTWATPASNNPALGSLLYSTFIGGSIVDQGNDIVHDGTGHAYVVGEYLSIDDFPLRPGAFTLLHDIDGFVAKVNVDGQSLDYLFHVTAEFEEAPHGVVVDSTGRAYVAGRTSSLDFPTTPGAWDTTPNGAGDAWLLKLDPTGTTLEFSTAFGSPGREWFLDVAIDGTGNLYATGLTNSTNTPTSPGAYDRTFNGDWDAFLVKFNNTGTSVVYSTYLGGTGYEEGNDVAVDPAGNAVVTGYSTSASNDYPVSTGPFGTLGLGDMLVTMVNPAGGGLVWSTLIGGAGLDISRGVELDSAQQIYLAGSSQSASGFPTTTGAYDETHNGGDDVAVVQLNATATTINFASFIGGSGDDVAHAFDLGTDGNLYLAGNTTSADLPVTLNAYASALNGTSDGFVARLSASFANLDYATYFGGSETETIFDLASESSGTVYLTGRTLSADFPISALAYDTSHNGSDDVFVSKISGISGAPTAIMLQSTQVDTDSRLTSLIGLATATIVIIIGVLLLKRRLQDKVSL